MTEILVVGPARAPLLNGRACASVLDFVKVSEAASAEAASDDASAVAHLGAGIFNESNRLPPPQARFRAGWEADPEAAMLAAGGATSEAEAAKTSLGFFRSPS